MKLLNIISQIIFLISVIGFVGVVILAIYLESLTNYHLGIIFGSILTINFFYQLYLSKDTDDLPAFRG